jgi:hypothetical protein
MCSWWYTGIVVEDERTSQCAKEVIDVDDEDDNFVVEPVDLAKN